jgi:hypothetical protein
MTYKELKPIVRNLIKRTAGLKKRKIVHLMLKEFEQKTDIKVLRGFRGVGKAKSVKKGGPACNEVRFLSDWSGYCSFQRLCLS